MYYVCICVIVGVDVRIVRKRDMRALEGRCIEFADMLIDDLD